MWPFSDADGGGRAALVDSIRSIPHVLNERCRKHLRAFRRSNEGKGARHKPGIRAVEERDAGYDP
jgi:hypothetical protein